MEIEIPIQFLSDEKGYIDRECPNEDCLYNYKIKLSDWQDKVSDYEVHCPMCGHIDNADQWFTEGQLEQMTEIAEEYALSYVQNELDKMFTNFARKSSSKFLKIEYKPGKRISFINNPVGQSDSWEQEIVCEKCGTTYSVIGSAYFCPCCGHNSASSSFNESMNCLENMMNSIDEMKVILTQSQGLDNAESICRSLIENGLGICVSAFQKFAHCMYCELTGKTARLNDFQIVQKGNDMFSTDVGHSYLEWIDENELFKMNLYFQRRHLIEHNNGMVDQRYIEKSNDNQYSIGQRIIVKKSDVYSLINIVKKLANGIMTISGKKE